MRREAACAARARSPGSARAGAGALGWYPGDWIWPALLALVVAIVAGVVSAVWLADDSSSANGTLVRTQAGPSTSVPTQTAPEPTTTTATTATTPTGTTAPPPPPPPKPARSPRGRPRRAAGRSCSTRCRPPTAGAGAVGEAKQALRLGLKPVGVLDSADFSSLHPGYYVVFFGIYGNEAEAQSHVIEAHRRGYPEPYPRRITR